MTDEEIYLLKKLASGVLDGLVGDDLTTLGDSRVWTVIENGVPARYKRGPGGRYFDGKENVRYDGVLRILQKWETDEEKLQFLQKFGWLMNDPDVKAYSAKFKPKR